MKLKAVIIGCGNIAGGYDLRSKNTTVMTHAGGFAACGEIQLVGAFDPNLAQLESFCAAWGGEAAPSIEALLERHRPDVVSICSPNSTHFSVFQAALSAKPKAILCEKPISLTLQESRQMVASARSEGIQLLVNYIRRWDLTLEAFERRLMSGEFGKVLGGRVLYTKGLFHNASHGINLLEKWLGAVKESSWIRMQPWENRDPGGDFYLQFDGAAGILFQWADAEAFNYFEMELLTERARIVLPGGGSSIRIYKRIESRLVQDSFGLPEEPELISGTLSQVMRAVATDVANAVLRGDKLKMAATEALVTMEVCENLRTQVEGKL